MPTPYHPGSTPVNINRATLRRLARGALLAFLAGCADGLVTQTLKGRTR